MARPVRLQRWRTSAPGDSGRKLGLPPVPTRNPMLSMLRGPLTAGLIAISMLCCTADALGAAKIVRGTAATGEDATVAPSIGEQAFMRSRYWRMRTFAPDFNARLSWAPDA